MPRLTPWLAAVGRTLVLYQRLDGTLRRIQNGVSRFVRGVLVEAISLEEQRDLTIHLYSEYAPFPTELQAWEESWYQRRLPPGPAHILIGGAGSGREVSWLRSREYTVDALEPAPDCLPALQRAVGPGQARAATYEDLSQAVLEGSSTPASPLDQRRYDAIILGWGSLNHVVDERERKRLMRTCARLTDGPILASFWLRVDDRMGRAEEAGLALGRRLAAWRGIRSNGRGQGFFGHGFAHAFTLEEIAELAETAGRALEWEPRLVYPHMTLLAAGAEEEP